MRHLILALLLLPVLTFAAPPGDGWKLTQAYEFDEPDGHPDLTNWDTRYVWDRDTIINNEDQYYVDPATWLPNPFWIDDGVLLITATPTSATSKAQVKDKPYTSGVLTTRSNGYSQLYGYWEARLKLPNAKGAWPAFWLLPTHDQWPAGVAVLSEIDIMEAIHDVSRGIYHASAHSNETGELVSSGEAVTTGADLVGQFNTYGLSWDAQYIVWYFNDKEVRRLPTPSDMTVARHILLNLAVGGWGGTSDVLDYPAHFLIDYVRVYAQTNVPTVVKANPYPVEFQRIVDHLFDVYNGK